MVFNLYEYYICSDVVTVFFWIFFIYSLFFAGECPSLVKNVEVEFETSTSNLKKKYVCWPAILNTLFT